MFKLIQIKSASALLAVVALAFHAGIAAAAEMTDQIPSAANAGAIVDVKGLLASPLGQKEAWQGKLVGGYAERPLAVPAYAERFGLAATLEFPELSPMWQVGLIQLSTKPDLSRVAREQKGVLDTIDGKPAVTTQFNVLHVAVSDQTIATMWPAQRQLAARLLNKEGVARGPSAYLAGALKLDSNHAVMALDLNEAFSGASIRKAMAMGGLSSLDQVEDIKKVSDALAAAKGVTVHVKVDQAVNLHMIADFAGPVPIPAANLKAFCLEMLGDAGLPTEPFSNLNYEMKGNQIVASGAVPTNAVQALLGLLVPDVSHASLAAAVTPSAAAPTPAPNAPSDPAAAASQQYFKAITAILDQISATPKAITASSVRGHARRIQQLPVLNVDPELVAWGVDVIDRLNQCANIISVGQQNAANAAQTIASPTSEATYSDTGVSSSDTAASRAAFRNAQQQRRQAAQAERTRAAEQAFQVIADSSKERNTIRAKMTSKYGVEF